MFSNHICLTITFYWIKMFAQNIQRRSSNISSQNVISFIFVDLFSVEILKFKQTTSFVPYHIYTKTGKIQKIQHLSKDTRSVKLKLREIAVKLNFHTDRSKAVLLLWFLTVTCSCCPYLYFGSAIMLVTYFVNFRC